MYNPTLKIDGMMCGMCESHINDTIRKAVPVKKVSSSHTRGEAVVITDEPLDVEAVKAAVHATGYEVQSAASEPYEKKRFSLFGKCRRIPPWQLTARAVWYSGKLRRSRRSARRVRRAER